MKVSGIYLPARTSKIKENHIYSHWTNRQITGIIISPQGHHSPWHSSVSSLTFPRLVARRSCYPACPGYAPLHSLTHHSPGCAPLPLPIPFLPGLFTTSRSHPHPPARLHVAHPTPPHISTATRQLSFCRFCCRCYNILGVFQSR